MRNYIIILATLIPILASGQKRFQVHGGPTGGIYVPVLTGKASFTKEYAMSTEFFPWYGGAFLELSFGKRLGLQLEGLYTVSGYVWNLDGSSGPTGNNTEQSVEKFSYIAIPVLVKYKTGGFSVYGGYQFNKFNYAERRRDSYSGGDDLQQWYSANAMYVDSYSSLVICAEYSLRFGLGFSLRYVHGLDDITETGESINNTIYSAGDELRSSGALVGIYWSFGRLRARKN